MYKALTLSLLLGFGATFSVAQTVGCLATTSSLIGSYTFIGTQLPLAGVTISPPGSTTLYSQTPLGQLVGDITAGAPFSTSNVFYFDGNGHILIATSSAPLYPSTIVGTYTVNMDCTVNVTITDVNNTATSGPGISTPTQASVNLIGVVLGGGTEVDLTVAQSTTSTNGNMPVVTGQFDSRLLIQLVRSFNYGCSAATLTGSYGLIGTGFATTSSSSTTGTTTATGTGTTTPSGATQPIVFFASVTFDGNGNVVAQTPSTSTSPLASFNYMGTYTMNLNCSGTMTLSPPKSTSTTTTTGTGTSGTGTTGTGTTGTSTPTSSWTVNFVVIPPVTYAVNGSAILNGNADRASMLFSIQSSTETIFGYGRAQ
jgi:hypothetical protein